MRLSNRQNVVFRGLTEAQLPVLYARLETIGMARPGAELARDVVACPGADTCNIAVTQSRGLAKAIGEKLEEEGLAEVGGVRINISGCTNSCGQHHASDIGFFGAERRAHGRSAPGYQMLLGGYIGQEQAHFGEKALRLPAKAAPEAAVRVVRRFADERTAGETFRGWMDRSGGATAIAEGLKDLDFFPIARRGARVLRRLRRDRSVRGRNWRVGVRNLSPRYDAAVAAIDAANAADPTIVDVRGRTSRPRAGPRPSGHGVDRAAGRRSDETLLLAARAHHLRRWELPRDSYPAGRAGYLRWRRDQKARHATDVAAILAAVRLRADEIERVQRLIRRESGRRRAGGRGRRLPGVHRDPAGLDRRAHGPRSAGRRHPQDGPQDESVAASIWWREIPLGERGADAARRGSRRLRRRPSRSDEIGQMTYCVPIDTERGCAAVLPRTAAPSAGVVRGQIRGCTPQGRT